MTPSTRQSKSLKEFFFPRFPTNERLCPVLALKEYESRTRERRESSKSQLLIGTIRPYKAVCSSTVARWLKSVLTAAGIDTGIFKAHSVRGAASSAAANAGVTMNDILEAADWSTETVFQKFYYKPQNKTTFGKAVLSKLTTTDG